jgi:hypothetical protein
MSNSGFCVQEHDASRAVGPRSSTTDSALVSTLASESARRTDGPRPSSKENPLIRFPGLSYKVRRDTGRSRILRILDATPQHPEYTDGFQMSSEQNHQVQVGRSNGSKKAGPVLSPELAKDQGAYEGTEPPEEDSTCCICRRAKDEGWMIQCDGGCERWFQVSRVDLHRGDRTLIDKFVCPNCEAAGHGRTI